MTAPRKEINLLPQESWEKKPIGRIIKWALTIGRYIVITTELIVIICFISRFKLDRDLSDLYEGTEIKQARIKSMEKFEKEFRLTQNQLKTIKELRQIRNDPQETLGSFNRFIPFDITLDKLEFTPDKLKISGYSLSESGLAVLINHLKESPQFSDIEITNLSKGKELEINFSLSTSLNL